MTGMRLVCDLGGTNVRFALVDAAGSVSAVEAYPLARFPDFAGALAAYLSEHAAGARIDSAAIGAAGPADGPVVRLTNAPWTIDQETIGEMLGTGRVGIFNDLEAVARAVPLLGDGDLASLRGRGVSVDHMRSAIAVNVGTGFGAAGLVRQGSGATATWRTRASEAGHMLAALFDDDDQARSIEHWLSGDGVARLAADQSGAAAFPDGRAVFAAAAEGDDRAIAVADAFGWRLGRAARDLVLAHGAWDGVYLVGGVVLGWHALDRPTAFETGFAVPGPMEARLADVPVQVITASNPALIGLGAIDI